MTKSEYAVLLTDPRWNEVRLRILKRDNYRCRRCKADNRRLNVHHKIYLEGKMPWEVPDQHLISLCDYCHAKAHEGRLISSFIRKSIPEPVDKSPENKHLKKTKKVKRQSRKKGKQVKKVWIAGRGLVEVPKKKSNKK